MNVIGLFTSQKHPNLDTLSTIKKFFDTRGINASVNASKDGYVVKFESLCSRKASFGNEPIAKIKACYSDNNWTLYWISEELRWDVFDSYEKLSQALYSLLLFNETAE